MFIPILYNCCIDAGGFFLICTLWAHRKFKPSNYLHLALCVCVLTDGREGECESARVELLPLCTHLSKYDTQRRPFLYSSSILFACRTLCWCSIRDEMVWNGLKTIVKGKQVQCYHNHQEGGGGRGEGVKICQPLGNISTTHHHPLYQHSTRKCGDILNLKGPSHQIRLVYESTHTVHKSLSKIPG